MGNFQLKEHSSSLNMTLDGYKKCYKFKFDNGYGASVIKELGAMDQDENLYTLVIIKWLKESRWILLHNTYLDEIRKQKITIDEVNEILYEVQNI